MITFKSGSNSIASNIKLGDYFIELLGCFVPGFLFFTVLTYLAIGTLFIVCSVNSLNSYISIKVFIDIFKNVNNIFYIMFWIHVSIFLISYMLGFLLYRQDPKTPDYISYLKIRDKVNGPKPWVISYKQGITPDDVQYPYSNLAEYLRARGVENVDNIIPWKAPDSIQSKDYDCKENFGNRSKLFINSLKLRINFFFPECYQVIVKNEAHIRFSSSIWYGTTITFKLIYLSIIAIIVNFLLFYNPSMDANSKVSANALMIIILVVVATIFFAKEIYVDKLFDELRCADKINSLIKKIKLCLYAYDLLPIVIMIFITIFFVIFFNTSSASEKYILSITANYFIVLLMVSFIVFYVKHKIEESFHYQRVREIIYVIEIASLSKVFDCNHKLDDLWNLKIGKNINENTCGALGAETD